LVTIELEAFALTEVDAGFQESNELMTAGVAGTYGVLRMVSIDGVH
jgi:hypothetical protein